MRLGSWQITSQRRFCPSRYGRPDDRFDDSHIFHCIAYRYRNLCPFQYRARESISLNRILVADGESFDGDTASKNIAAIIDQKCGMVGRSER